MKKEENSYSDFIKQRRFENELENMFDVAKQSKQKEEIVEEKEVSVKPVKHKEPKEKLETPPKDFNVDPMVKQAEKFVPNNLNKKDAGIDINALAVSLKSDPNFMSKMQPRQGLNVGSGLGIKETIQLIKNNPGRIDELNDVGDVNVHNYQDGQVLAWDADEQHWHNRTVSATGGGTVGVDQLSTPDYIGASADNGVLRTSDEFTYADGGDFVTIGLNQSVISASQINNDVPFANQADLLTVSGDVVTNTANILALSGAVPDVEDVVLYVSTSGIDSASLSGTEFDPYKTISFALSQITDNSASKKYVINVMPGNHTETANPVQLKSYVSIQAVGNRQTTRVISGNSDDLFLGAPVTSIREISLEGVAGYYNINMASSGSLLLDNISVINNNGIFVNNDNATVNVDGIAFLTFGPNTINNGICVSGGNVIIRKIDVVSTASINKCIDINKQSSIVTVKDFTSFSPNVSACIGVGTSGRCIVSDINFVAPVDGIIVSDGCNVRINGGVVFNAQNNAMTVLSGGAGSTVGTNALTLQDSINYDLNILSSDSTVFGSGYLEINKIYAHPDAKLYGSYVDLFGGDEGVNILGELHVGTPRKPAESVFGEGDSYTGGMLVYTYDGTTSATENVSVSARSSSNSTFGFVNTDVDSSIYCASTIICDGDLNDYIPHYGIKANILSGHDGTGNVIAEYYTSGGTWEEIKTMSTDSGGSYYPHAGQLFENIGSQQVRYNNLVKFDGLGKTDPVGYGTDLYWIRFRIETQTDIAPIFEQFKLHSSRFEINSDGWIEYFGRARPISRLPWEIGVLEKAATAPGDQDLYLGDMLDVGGKKNRLDTGDIDRVGFKTSLPFDCDTSTPIVFDWSCIVATGGGDIDWVIRWGFNSDGDNVYRSAPGSDPVNMRTYIVTEPAPATADTVKWYRTTLDISDMLARRSGGFSDTIWLTIQRTGTTDTNNSDVSLVAIGANYTKWSEGGHI